MGTPKTPTVPEPADVQGLPAGAVPPEQQATEQTRAQAQEAGRLPVEGAPDATAGATVHGFAEDDNPAATSPAQRFDLESRIRHEYSRFTARYDINLNGARAFNAGAAVPRSHPSVPAWLEDGMLVDAEAEQQQPQQQAEQDQPQGESSETRG